MPINSTRAFILALLATLGTALLFTSLPPRQTPPAAPTAQYGKLPLHFAANHGQAAAPVKFQARGDGYGVALTAEAAVLQVRSAECGVRNESNPQAIALRFANANPTPSVTGQDELPGKTNYLFGNDPARWQTNVPAYAQVRYHALYPGVDAVFYGNQRQLEYDLIVQPGADPSVIALQFDGADKLELDAAGDLLLHTKGGTLRQHKPVAYQHVNGGKRAIAARYVLPPSKIQNLKSEIRLALGDYDRGQPLVIDPVLSYATYLGGAPVDGTRCGGDLGAGIAVDAAGNAYVAGLTYSFNDLPLANPLQTQNNAGFSAFVSKLNAAGTAFVYSTYLGGTANPTGNTFATDIAVDAAGNAYVCGVTQSATFPTTAGAYLTTASNNTGFITKLAPSGSSLIYSTFLGDPNNGGFIGGFGDGEVTTIALDAANNAYVAGKTRVGGFPTTAGAFQPTLGANVADNAFVTKFNAAGAALVYSTFLGGSGAGVNDQAISIAVDAANNAYVTGVTSGPNFPVTAGAFKTTYNGGFRDAFVTKLNAAGAALIYSTYLGGGGRDEPTGIAVDAGGSAYVTGFTEAAGFPVTPGAFRPFYSAGTDAFVTKFNASGTALVYATALGGGASGTGGAGIALDANGNAAVTGTGFGAYRLNAVQSADNDAFVLKLNAAGTALIFSTPLGGNSTDVARAIAVDAAGSAYITGNTFSTNYPVTPGAPQTSYRDGCFYGDAFIAKIGVQAGDCPVITINPQPLPIATMGQSYSQQLTAAGGTAPYTFDLFPGVPNSFFQLTLSAAGLISSPNLTLGAGTYTFSIRATDANGCVGVRPYAFIVNAPNCPASFALTPTSMNFPAAGGDGSVAVTAAGGCAWQAKSNVPWATINAGFDGVGNGTTTFSVAASLSPARSGTLTIAERTFTINQASGCPAITVGPLTLNHGTVNAAYSQMVTATGSTVATTFSVTTGNLPAGVSLNATTGALTGTPTAPGTFNFTITATDANGCTGTRQYTVNIACQPITVNPATLNAGTALSPYAQNFTQTGGFGVTNFSLTGALPAGLSFFAGFLSGTPTQAGSFPLTVTATDANGCAGMMSYTLTINCAFALAPVMVTTNANAATGSVTVTTQAGCAWTATSNAAFLTITGGTPGTGNGTVSYSVAQNTTGSPRTGTLTIAGQTFTLMQTETAGVEGDVAPRPAGNDMVNVADYVQVGRFAIGLDTAANGSEFQRADCAPRGTLGNGQITVADYVQAGRYAIGLDPRTDAGGPTMPSAALPIEAFDWRRTPDFFAPPRVLQLAPVVVEGAAWQAAVELRAQGDENAVGVTVNFDARALRLLRVQPGRDAAAGRVLTRAARGEASVMLLLPPGVALAAGARQVLVLEFAPRHQLADARSLTLGAAAAAVNVEADSLPVRTGRR